MPPFSSKKGLSLIISLYKSSVLHSFNSHFETSAVNKFSGLQHQGQFALHPYKNTVVLMPGPSCRENLCMFVVFIIEAMLPGLRTLELFVSLSLDNFLEGL